MLLRAFQLTIHDSQGQVSSNKLSYRVWLINPSPHSISRGRLQPLEP